MLSASFLTFTSQPQRREDAIPVYLILGLATRLLRNHLSRFSSVIKFQQHIALFLIEFPASGNTAGRLMGTASDDV